MQDFPDIQALRKEQEICLVNLAHGKDVFAILPTGFGMEYSAHKTINSLCVNNNTFESCGAKINIRQTNLHTELKRQ